LSHASSDANVTKPKPRGLPSAVRMITASVTCPGKPEPTGSATASVRVLPRAIGPHGGASGSPDPHLASVTGKATTTDSSQSHLPA
jgi:hypothetical protein